MPEREKSEDPVPELNPDLAARLGVLLRILQHGWPEQPSEAAVEEIFGPIAHCATCGGRIALVERPSGVGWRHLDLADFLVPHEPMTLRTWTPPPTPDWLFLPAEFGELLDEVIQEQDSVPAAQETGESNQDADGQP